MKYFKKFILTRLNNHISEIFIKRFWEEKIINKAKYQHSLGIQNFMILNLILILKSMSEREPVSTKIYYPRKLHDKK